MKTLAITAMLLLAIAGCIQTPPPASNNTTNITPPANNTSAIPPGYEVKDYCQEDSDCVRLNSCCDCGLGVYVNTYSQQPECPPGEPVCKCAMALSHGECRSQKCAAVAGEGNPAGPGISNETEVPPSGFCGRSTNGTCSSDSDCITGGCSGHICQSASEPPVITTCEYAECYDAQSYGASCGCHDGKCRWR